MQEKMQQKLLAGDSVSAAKGLIGWRLHKIEPNGNRTGGAIIETEAYNQDDAASHSFKGQTPRDKP
jgi:DNA-3-methyladenine glycosylase